MKYVKWTEALARKAAKQCRNRNDFQRRFQGAYKFCVRNGLLDSVCEIFAKRAPDLSDFYAACVKEAKKHAHRNQFKLASSHKYEMSRQYGWLDDICTHMTQAKTGPKTA